jgi:hypothetical protein
MSSTWLTVLFKGESLLAKDKCGEAIRSLQESKKLYGEAREFAGEYATTKVGIELAVVGSRCPHVGRCHLGWGGSVYLL